MANMFAGNLNLESLDLSPFKCKDKKILNLLNNY